MVVTLSVDADEVTATSIGGTFTVKLVPVVGVTTAAPVPVNVVTGKVIVLVGGPTVNVFPLIARLGARVTELPLLMLSVFAPNKFKVWDVALDEIV